MGRWLVLCAVASAACYRPALEAPCTVVCETPNGDNACPGNQQCGNDLRCHTSGAVDCIDRRDASLPQDGQVCVGQAFFQVCFVPADKVVLVDETINTGTDPRCVLFAQANGFPEACVIAGSNVSVTSVVRAIGTRPLILAAADTIEINAGAVLDVASHADGSDGAGAATMAPACTISTPGTKSSTAGLLGGGGAGGSFQGQGGKGGGGGGGNGGTQGEMILADDAHGLAGACPASVGGDGFATGIGGAAGRGGGAIALIATKITTGAGSAVNASGAPGQGGAAGLSGGGGAGAGGMILLDGQLTFSGVLMANGGGGGGCSGTSTDGPPGMEPSIFTPLSRAAGGPVAGGPGSGGMGGAGNVPGGGFGIPNGGGGGGAVGFIFMAPVVELGGLVSPPALKP